MTLTRISTVSPQFTLYEIDGHFDGCFLYAGCGYDFVESNVMAFDYYELPPPPCVAFSREIYAAALRYGVRLTWLAAIAAHESGKPTSDDASNIDEIGGGIGQGIFQITDASDCEGGVNPGTADVAGNAMCGAKKMSEYMTICGDEREAEAFYNTGRCTGRRVAQREWAPGELIPYQDSVTRFETRIIDYKSVGSA